MEISKIASTALSQMFLFEGMSLELSMLLKGQTFIHLTPAIESEDIRVGLRCNYFDADMILYVLQKMFANGSAIIQFKDDAIEEEYNYVTNQSIATSLYNRMRLDGISIELSSELSCEEYIHIKDAIESGDLKIHLNDEATNNDKILAILQELIDKDLAKIVFTSEATEKDINYLKKLSKSVAQK